MTSTENGVIGRWPWALLSGGIAGVAGALLHPDQDPSLNGPTAIADWIADPFWMPSHILILLAALLFAPGLLGLTRSGLLAGAARTTAWVAAAVSVLYVIESVPHLLAPIDHSAVLSDGATPFLNGHQFGSLLVYPLFGFSVAALAFLSGRRLVHPAVGVLGALGAVAFGFAPIAVGPLDIDEFGVLFSGGLLMASWFAVVGGVALSRRQSIAAA
jgi:hypothetical protein